MIGNPVFSRHISGATRVHAYSHQNSQATATISILLPLQYPHRVQRWPHEKLGQPTVVVLHEHACGLFNPRKEGAAAWKPVFNQDMI
jgi:hypothetical protein